MLTDREISLLFSALYRILGALDSSHRELLTTLCETSDSRYVSMMRLERVLYDEAAALEATFTGRDPRQTIPNGSLVYVSGHPGGGFSARVESSEMIDGALHYALTVGGGAKPLRTYYRNVRRVEENNTGSSPDGFVAFKP